jgi:hypothetical protein
MIAPTDCLPRRTASGAYAARCWAGLPPAGSSHRSYISAEQARQWMHELLREAVPGIVAVSSGVTGGSNFGTPLVGSQ